MSVEPTLGLFSISLNVEKVAFAVPLAAESLPIINLFSVGAKKSGLFWVEFEALMQFENFKGLLKLYNGLFANWLLVSINFIKQ